MYKGRVVTEEAPRLRERISGKAHLYLAAGAVSFGIVAATSVAVLLDAGKREAGAVAGPYRGSEPRGRNVLPGFALRSYRGERVASTELRGRVVLLTLLDSQCHDACPVLASSVARAVDRLKPSERARVTAVALTVNPAGDTPNRVRRFLRDRRAEGRLDYLLGPERALRPVWAALQVLPSADTGVHSIHSAPLRIYDSEGVWVATLHAGADLSESNLLHDIRVALAEGRR
jgi:cytochrome oxidase Cu insertion factor (SCO1/SenC/PrrC family)